MKAGVERDESAIGPVISRRLRRTMSSGHLSRSEGVRWKMGLDEHLFWCVRVLSCAPESGVRARATEGD